MANMAKAGFASCGIELFLGANAHAVKLFFDNHAIWVSVRIITEQGAVGRIRQRIWTVLVKMNGN